MKLVRFSIGHGPVRTGAIIGGRVFPLGDLVPGAPADMCDVIARWAI